MSAELDGFRVTDAQVHVWEAPEMHQRPAHMGTTFPISRLEAAMEEGGVDRAVLIPSTVVFRGDAAAGNAYAFAAAEKSPKKFAVMAIINLGQPEAGAFLDALMERPAMKGLRILLRNETEETLGWLASQAVRYNLPIAVLANRGSFPVLPSFLERNPDVRVLLDHAALPAHGPDPFAEFDGVIALAKYKNLIVKSSAMSRWSKEPYPFKDIHHHIRRLYDAFGPQRLAWGSDYSWEVGRIPYSECVDLFREACDFMSASDREWILDRTLSEFIGWPR